MKQVLKKSLLAGAAFLALAASLPTPLPAHAQGKEVNTVVSSEMASIDPAKASDAPSGNIIHNVFEGLTRESQDFKSQVPGAAESWQVSEDGKTYTFKLRSDAKWSNGDPVTAGDFEYAWKRVINPETGADYAGLFFVIEGAQAYNEGKGSADQVGVKAIDDTTLEVKLVNPTAYFLSLTSFYAFAPVNKKVVEANADWADDLSDKYVTNGAFKLAEWNHNADLALEKNDQYWDKDNVKVDRVNAQIVESDSTVTKMFQSGEIDFVSAPFGTLSLDSFEGFKKQGILKVTPQSAIYVYKINTKDSVMSNVNIRKALALAIDRQGLVTNITKAEQKPAKGIVPASVTGFEADANYFKDADYEGAKEYLAKGLQELGLKDPSELTVKISMNTSEAHAAIAQYIQEGWSKNLGIKVELDNSEFQVYLDRLKTGDFQVARLGWSGDFNDALTFLDQYRSADAGNNYTGWENADYAKSLEEAAKETDANKRLEILKKAEKVLMDEMPVIPIYDYTQVSVKKDNIKGLATSPLGKIDLKYLEVE